MKKVLLHSAFWLIYLIQDTLLAYLWDGPQFLQLPVAQRILLSVLACMLYLIPKIILTYYVLYGILPKLFSNKRDRQRNIIYLLLALTAASFVYRVLVVFLIDPVIYKGLMAVPRYFRLLSFMLSIMDMGFAVGAATAIKLVRLQLASKENEKNLVKEKLETELKFLRNQTNPHFLFNTLNNIYALARKKSDETPEVVMKLSKLLRFMLYETKRTVIPIGDEMKMLDDYIELERIRYNGRLTINFLREVDNESELISPLLLLPFVENAFKHGASESRFESFIHIVLKLQNSVLHFNIENTKEPGGEEYVTENIGLSNVKRQLELMYKEYDMQVQNEKTLFKVNLTINLLSHAKI